MRGATRAAAVLFLSVLGAASVWAQDPQGVGVPDFQKHFSGTINGTIRIEADLSMHHGAMTGWYRYARIGQPIVLSGGTLNVFELRLSEYAEGLKNDPTGYFNGAIDPSGASISGRWISADGSRIYPFELKESYDSAWQFEMAFLDKEQPLSATVKDSPKATYTRVAVAPDGKASPKARAFFIRNFLGGKDPMGAIDADAEDYFKGYFADNQDQDVTPDAPWLTWDHEDHLGVMYNSAGIVVLVHDVYDYTGGAHGSSVTTYTVVDMKALRILTLADVFKADALPALGTLITGKAREMSGLDKDQSLQDAGYFVDALDPTDNFYVCPAGVGFVYGQYDVAPYVMGSLEVFLAQKDIAPYLKPGFTLP